LPDAREINFTEIGVPATSICFKSRVPTPAASASWRAVAAFKRRGAAHHQVESITAIATASCSPVRAGDDHSSATPRSSLGDPRASPPVMVLMPSMIAN
jgi:hypothetical protein